MAAERTRAPAAHQMAVDVCLVEQVGVVVVGSQPGGGGGDGVTIEGFYDQSGGFTHGWPVP